MKIVKDLVRLFLPFVGGNIIGKVIANETKQDYEDFKKPPFAPPKIAFPIVWSILYLIMGFVYMAIRKKDKDSLDVMVTHCTQLILNFSWTLLYFKWKLRFTALIDSFLLLIAVVVQTVVVIKKRPIIGMLLLPYVVWSAYASYLTTGNWILNKDNPNYSNDI
ncbi:TspO/MBR family protein [Staphylococcus massiliensis]|uniref:Tryptophan-rich sensory protein n=1 Tax=Staphylococcus massiliensis S46 TaxID=1229783 RepID=K9AQW2_9STAP|nr:TspO/MBR family protein [Staphylococcus massiliensis]EKU49828.1 hypothetical protein C273_02990 [Staphylococcus massiliensis S46]MCG3401064.1 tryptophan-rich sensory protein [Staphylococcus massiliensis]PNZ99296.1 tryptophan-rich sensory protein [Staphylococcus massiliensis CCUG 55927]